MKKLIPAFALLLVSAVLMSTAPFAWFSMNTTVSATNMQVKAVAEDGLLINEIATAADTHWDNEGTANQLAADAVLLYPTSTANGTTWYHAASEVSNNAAGATAANTKSDNLVDNTYETLPTLTAITSMSVAASAGVNAERNTMGKSATDTAGYYVHYTYYLKGAAGTATTLGTSSGDMNVRINSVTATPATTHSTALNASLRVGIKLNSTFYIYAPITGYTSSYYVAAGASATAPIAGNVATPTDLAELPAAGSNGVPVEVYIWYEGEDAACKSDNATAAELDAIDVDIVFGLVKLP